MAYGAFLGQLFPRSSTPLGAGGDLGNTALHRTMESRTTFQRQQSLNADNQSFQRDMANDAELRRRKEFLQRAYLTASMTGDHMAMSAITAQMRVEGIDPGQLQLPALPSNTGAGKPATPEQPPPTDPAVKAELDALDAAGQQATNFGGPTVYPGQDPAAIGVGTMARAAGTPGMTSYGGGDIGEALPGLHAEVERALGMPPTSPAAPAAPAVPPGPQGTGVPPGFDPAQIQPSSPAEQMRGYGERVIGDTFVAIGNSVNDPREQEAAAVAKAYAQKRYLAGGSIRESIEEGQQMFDRLTGNMYRRDWEKMPPGTGGRPKGGGGAPGVGVGKGGANLYNTVTDNVRQDIAEVKRSNDFVLRGRGIDSGTQVLRSLDLKTGTGDRNALGQYIKSITGAAATDTERSFYEAAAGKIARLESIYNSWAEGGKLAPATVSELQQLIAELTQGLQTRQQEVIDQALAGADASIEWGYGEAGVTDEQRMGRAKNYARKQLGVEEAPRPAAPGTTPPQNKTDRARRLRELGGY